MSKSGRFQELIYNFCNTIMNIVDKISCTEGENKCNSNPTVVIIEIQQNSFLANRVSQAAGSLWTPTTMCFTYTKMLPLRMICLKQQREVA